MMQNALFRDSLDFFFKMANTTVKIPEMAKSYHMSLVRKMIYWNMSPKILGSE